MIDASSITRAEYVAAARRYLGVRFQHQGRTGRGLDCVGLALRSAHDLGLTLFDFTTYRRVPDGETLERKMREVCAEIDPARATVADLLLIRYTNWPQHLAIVTGGGAPHFRAIHAFNRVGVVEVDLGPNWFRSYRAEVYGAFSLPGIRA